MITLRNMPTSDQPLTPPKLVNPAGSSAAACPASPTAHRVSGMPTSPVPMKISAA